MEQMCSLNKEKRFFNATQEEVEKDGMEYRTLGLSGLRISPVGLGCMGMSHAYGAPADKCKITELLTDAVDMGYTFLTRPKCMDTQDRTNGNEELLGKALQSFRNQIVIASKFGI